MLGKGGIKAPGGLSSTKANTEVTAAPSQPCPHTPAPSYKGPHPKQSVQAVEVSWPSHACCCGCYCCPHSVVQVLVSVPGLSLPSSPPGTRWGGSSGPSPPFTELWLCAKRIPSLYIVFMLKMRKLRPRGALGLVQGHAASGH